LDIKLKKSKVETAVLVICGTIFFIALTTLIQKAVYYRYNSGAFVLMFISLIGIFIIGVNKIFNKWNSIQQQNRTLENDDILKKRICKLHIPLIPYYLLSLLILNLCKRSGGYTFAQDLIAYNHLTYILWFIYLVIPVCYEIIVCYHIIIYYSPEKRQIKKLEMMLELIADGNWHISNPFSEKEAFFNYGESLVNLGSITSQAMEDQLRDEKMKIELITNVSHDLKTPLTSMIGYIDLIKKEDLSEIMKDYVTGIADKAEKLNEMIQSLFDLAKTASGNMELHMETINMNRLVMQIIADMDHIIKNNDKIIKLSLTEDAADFIADSASMYRVCQNLIENAIKYSLSGSRIIIATFVHDSHINLTIKNVANYEMNFSESEIVDRFTRADKARTTSGNGLGLAIAKTYTEACSGHFSVKIDDDVFVAKVEFEIGKTK